MILGLTILILIGLWLWPKGKAPGESEEFQDSDPSSVEMMQFNSPASIFSRSPVTLPKKAAGMAQMTPDEVIDNRGCQMTMGKGTAASLALLTIQGNSETRFSILDQTGALISGILPFRSHQNKFGRGRNGTVVAGFGGMHLNPSWSEFYDAREALRIYVDDQVVYENDDVWLFDVANNGASYFFIEPLGTDFSSRLVISNLEDGTETVHDLGKLFSTPTRRVAYRASYAIGSEEVYLRPDHFDFSEGVGSHYFFPAKTGGEGRKITVPNTGRDDRAYFVSSQEGYFFYGGIEGLSGFRVVKNRFDWTNNETLTEWELEGPVGMRGTFFDATPNGAWILFGTGTSGALSRPAEARDWMLFVLDATSGQPVFKFPIEDADLQLSRLSTVLPPEATAEDAGIFRGAFFVGNEKLVLQHYPMADGLFDIRKSVYDVFDLNSIALDSQPDFRLSINRHDTNSCASENFPYNLKVGEDDKLVYARAELH